VSSLQNCRKLLKLDGKLVLVETTKDWLFTGFMLGALPGYWLGADDGRPDSPFLSKDRWNEALQGAGFNGADIVLDDYSEPASCTTLIVARNTGRDTYVDSTSNSSSSSSTANKANDSDSSSSTSGTEISIVMESLTVTLVRKIPRSELRN
jgi:hypothetical protein